MNDQPDQREDKSRRRQFRRKRNPMPACWPRRAISAFGLLHLLEHAAKRLVADRCMQVAASLSFTTLLSLVPFLAISLSFVSAFSQFCGSARPRRRRF